jgi:hypothetical protein
MEYLGLRMVDPDDRVEVCCHVLVLLGSESRRRLVDENYRGGASTD